MVICLHGLSCLRIVMVRLHLLDQREVPVIDFGIGNLQESFLEAPSNMAYQIVLISAEDHGDNLEAHILQICIIGCGLRVRIDGIFSEILLDLLLDLSEARFNPYAAIPDVDGLALFLVKEENAWMNEAPIE